MSNGSLPLERMSATCPSGLNASCWACGPRPLMSLCVAVSPLKSHKAAVPAAVPTRSFLPSGLNSGAHYPVGLEQRSSHCVPRSWVPKTHVPILAGCDGDVAVGTEGDDMNLGRAATTSGRVMHEDGPDRFARRGVPQPRGRFEEATGQQPRSIGAEGKWAGARVMRDDPRVGATGVMSQTAAVLPLTIAAV